MSESIFIRFKPEGDDQWHRYYCLRREDGTERVFIDDVEQTDCNWNDVLHSFWHREPRTA